MKFGHKYQEALERAGYPPRWVEAAISYRDLKKCIKRVETELAEFGIKPEMLENPDEETIIPAGHGRGSPTAVRFHYAAPGVERAFHPRLTVFLGPRDQLCGDLEVLWHSVSHSPSSSRVEDIESVDALKKVTTSDATPATLELSSPLSDFLLSKLNVEADRVHVFKIPLLSDSEFFDLLSKKLHLLQTLEQEEQDHLIKSTALLGEQISDAATPTRSVAKSDLYTWREIIEIYTEADIFFSRAERDSGVRSPVAAQQQLQLFMENLEQQNVVNRFKKKESRVALQQFLTLNMDLLRNLKFQEINYVAMTKILKKFDKRTAFGVKDSFTQIIEKQPMLPRTMAKAMCFKITESLTSVVPQLSDYLCPVCFSISFKPIRLRCQHVFCIRCLVVMQRAKEDHCPLCRGSVIMQADSSNLDFALMGFLQRYFPDEVKEKQKDNEVAAGVDRYGEDFNKCRVM